ncbi:MAG: tetratricopeptide (TPR) repeat protein, partial [Candidatus Krumholzibacteriia bacterium]
MRCRKCREAARINKINEPDHRIGRAKGDPIKRQAARCWRGLGAPNGTVRLQKWTMLALVLVLSFSIGCAKFNTYHNAKRSFDRAENIRNDFLERHEDPPTPAGAQRADYENAYKKAQKILDQYPGHSLTDDALFLQAKAQHRLEAYRQSIRKLDLLFQNYPATPYLEEAFYVQGLNYLLIGALVNSQDYLDRLAKSFPDSKYLGETQKVSGDNAFALREWQSASESYRNYLDQDSDLEDRDRVGLKLAECYWELEEFGTAAVVLQEVSQNTNVPELDFRARLLRARVHVRIGDYDIVENLTDGMRGEADLYGLQGEVLLVDAESLVAQDRTGDVASLIEGMPEDWGTPIVKARAAEIMGEIYMDRDEWDRAREQFQTALGKRNDL